MHARTHAHRSTNIPAFCSVAIMAEESVKEAVLLCRDSAACCEAIMGRAREGDGSCDGDVELPSADGASWDLEAVPDPAAVAAVAPAAKPGEGTTVGILGCFSSALSSSRSLLAAALSGAMLGLVEGLIIVKDSSGSSSCRISSTGRDSPPAAECKFALSSLGVSGRLIDSSSISWEISIRDAQEKTKRYTYRLAQLIFSTHTVECQRNNDPCIQPQQRVNHLKKIVEQEGRWHFHHQSSYSHRIDLGMSETWLNSTFTGAVHHMSHSIHCSGKIQLQSWGAGGVCICIHDSVHITSLQHS